MRIAVVHGYYLADSGSGTYVRELTRALVEQGHDVTLVCQEREPESFDFIDSAYALDSANAALTSLFERPPSLAGRCRFVRPDLGGRLLVYVEGPFPGFPLDGVKAFHNAPSDWIDAYAAANAAALRTAFARWQPELVMAHHSIMQPHAVRTALAGSAPYTVTTHGSDVSFSLAVDPRLAEYAVYGLEGAAAVVAVSESSAADLTEWARERGTVLDAITVISPAVNAEVFCPATDRAAAFDSMSRTVELPEGFELSPDDDILTFVGTLRWTKGIQHVVAALPLIAERRPRIRLLVAGAGPAREPLARLAATLEMGDACRAAALVDEEADLRTAREFGPVVTGMPRAADGPRVAFLGHLTHDKLSVVLAAADVSITPSVFPEAGALVTTEALCAGALPVVGYHSGMTPFVDTVADFLGDPAFRSLVPGRGLTSGIAELVAHALERYPTKDAAFRSQLHELAVSSFPSWADAARRYVELGTAGAAARERP